MVLAEQSQPLTISHYVQRTEQLCQIQSDDIPKRVGTNVVRTMLYESRRPTCVLTAASPECRTEFVQSVVTTRAEKLYK
jgi:hypothetical protein